VYLTDWKRILIGNAPWEFLIEAVFRTGLMYIILLTILRLMGKRMNGQITILELAVMISLGAIVSLPMQSPDRGLLPGILLLLVIMFFQRGINGWSFRNAKVERLVQGHMSTLVKDGVIQMEEMEKVNVSQDQLFSQLRDHPIDHLGQVERVYLEACGLFSVFLSQNPQPGLAILPERDRDLLLAQPPADHIQACRTCGNVAGQPPLPQDKCRVCGRREWTQAVI
jgi:uncharacterized membrane protein YcaP (DUF421 family)